MNDYQRIEKVINYLNCKNINSLAKLVGIHKQNFYDIRNEKHGITAMVANAINNNYPEINLKWLLYEKGDMINEENNLVNDKEVKYGICENCKILIQDKKNMQLAIELLKKELEECKEKLPKEKRKVG